MRWRSQLDDRLSLRLAVTSLSERNYRLYFFGQLLSVSGTWMQTVAQSFLVLHLTGSGTALGLVTAARFLPILLFGPLGGVVVDRMDKRKLLYATQMTAGVLAGVFAAVVATGVVAMWLVYVLAICLGFVNVIDKPLSQSFISEMVSRDTLRNAVTLASITQNMARVIGAALGGLCVAVFGIATCFAINGASYAAVLVSLALMRGGELHRGAPVVRARGQVRAGLRYVRKTPELVVPLVMIAVVGTLAWEFQVTLPLLARSTFHGGAGIYGLMSAAMGLGAIFGGVITASRTGLVARDLGKAAIGWGIAIFAAAAAPSLVVELIALLVVGYGSISFNSIARTTLQLASVPAMRGRVMALWSVAWLGSTPIGGPIVGWIGQSAGARWPLVVGGASTLLAGVCSWPALKAIDAREASLSFGERPGGPPGP